MSDKKPLHRLNDRDISQQRPHRLRKLIKQEENDQFRENYPSFEVPTAYYKVIHVNKYTSMDEIYLLVNHLNECTQFTIDTESEKSNGKLALIQIQTIPHRLPLLVMLIELAHLPSKDSSMYVKIKNIFELIFRSNNELYSWGDLSKELYPAKEFYLFNWPIPASMINIQPLFSGWYEWALTRCESSDLTSQPNDVGNFHAAVRNQLLSRCACHQPSPYRFQELWSIQKALVYAAHMFIDKSSTWNHWAGGLTAHNSTLSSHRRKTMISYAIYDCFSATYFIRPILEKWTFNRLKNSNIIDLFTSFNSPPLPSYSTSTSIKTRPSTTTKTVKNDIDPQRLFNAINDDADLEDISDDEIYLNQINVPIINAKQDKELLDDKLQLNVELATDGSESPSNDVFNDMALQVEIHHEDELNVDSHDLVIDEELNHQQFIQEECTKIVHDDDSGQNFVHQSSHQRRTKEARKRRNKKRNTVHRIRRYQYHLTRSIYRKFNLPIIKKILREHDIRFTHVKVINEQLIIGVKKHLLQPYEQELPTDIFNRANYERYQKYHHHHHSHNRHHYTQPEHR